MLERDLAQQPHAEVDELASMLNRASLEAPLNEKKKQSQNIASARSTARLQENSTMISAKAKGLGSSMGSSKML